MSDSPPTMRASLIMAAYRAIEERVSRADFLLLAQASYDLLTLPDGRQETLDALTKK